MDPKPTEKHYCRECGHEMEWTWSENMWTHEGAWLVICCDVVRWVHGQPPAKSCLMAGEPFRHDRHTQEEFARRRAVRLIRRAHQGIIDNSKPAEEWIAEAVRRGIVPEDWRDAGKPELVTA